MITAYELLARYKGGEPSRIISYIGFINRDGPIHNLPFVRISTEEGSDKLLTPIGDNRFVGSKYKLESLNRNEKYNNLEVIITSNLEYMHSAVFTEIKERKYLDLLESDDWAIRELGVIKLMSEMYKIELN